MNDAGAGGSGSPAHQVRYGYDIFCDGQNVQRKGGNEGEVWEAFSRCLHMRVCRPDNDRNRNKGRPPDSGEQGDRINALLDPRNQEEYEETVDLAAREIFRMICLVDKRKFLQASTCQPILDKDVIEILKVELKAVRNEVKVEMKRDYQQRQHQHQLQQQEQARRDEERSRRDREEFEREKQEKLGSEERRGLEAVEEEPAPSKATEWDLHWRRGRGRRPQVPESCLSISRVWTWWRPSCMGDGPEASGQRSTISLPPLR